MASAATDAPATAIRPPAGRAARPRFRMVRTVTALMLREIATRYGRSPGGYLWEIAEPIAGIALLSFIFSATGMQPSIGKSFALFYATGFLPFTTYLDISGVVARSIPFSRSFLQYPCVSYMDTLVARLVLNFMTQSVLFIGILWGIDRLFDLQLVWDVQALGTALLMTGALGAGVGVVNCYLFMEFPVWERTWSIITRPLFLMSGIFFTYAMMPAAAQKVLWYNPLIHSVALTRKAVYGTYQADYANPLYVFSISLVLIFFGLLLLARHHRRLLEL